MKEKERKEKIEDINMMIKKTKEETPEKEEETEKEKEEMINTDLKLKKK